MKILLTGAHGFVGRNLIAELKNRGCTDVYAYDVDTDAALLEQYTGACDL